MDAKSSLGGRTALTSASYYGHPDAVSLLLDGGQWTQETATANTVMSNAPVLKCQDILCVC